MLKFKPTHEFVHSLCKNEVPPYNQRGMSRLQALSAISFNTRPMFSASGIWRTILWPLFVFACVFLLVEKVLNVPNRSTCSSKWTRYEMWPLTLMAGGDWHDAKLQNVEPRCLRVRHLSAQVLCTSSPAEDLLQARSTLELVLIYLDALLNSVVRQFPPFVNFLYKRQVW